MADPVSIVVGPIVNKVIEEVISLIKAKFHLLKDVQKDIENLESVLTAIRAVLQNAENRQLNEPPLRDWLGKLEEAVYDAEDVLAMFATEAYLWQRKRKVINFRSPFGYKLDAADKIKDILARLDKIAEEKKKFHLKVIIVNPISERRYPTPTSNVTESNVVGREDDKEKIIHMLRSEEFDRADDASVIPIIGMGGLGKTTLAQLVYNDQRVKDHFESRMWVCVTHNFDYSRILKEMIEYHSKMKYDINSLSNKQLVSRLLDFLVGQRFLLVLDDVWIESYLEWEPLKQLLEKGGKGCRVLVTSRNARVSNVMGTQPPYLLDCLPEDQCQSLFEKIVFTDPNLPGNVRRDLEKVGKEIVVKCKGLPLAVKAMAGLLRGKDDVNKWQRILNHEIREAEEQSTNTGKPVVLPALKLSYDHLPPHLKRCFAYCYIFPKAYVFDKLELIKLWKAGSFIQLRGQDTMDEIGSDYFDELLMRSFFQTLDIDNKERYRMHDLIHELARSVSDPHCCQVKDNLTSHISDRSRHVSLLCKDPEQPALEVIGKSKKLRTLLFPSEYSKAFGQSLDKMFHTLTYIRVLDLSSSTMKELPKSIKKLKLLCYLDLSKTDIRELPKSMCRLHNLRVLKLLGCLFLFELPKDLGNLVNLQHLELDDMFWYKVSALPPRMGNLKGLQNLHAFLVGHENGYGIEELKDMFYLTGTLHISKLENAVNAGEAKLKEKERLKKLVFEWSNSDGGPQDEAVLEDLQPHSNLKELHILHYRGINFPVWIRDRLLQNLATISLKHCTKCKVLSLGELPHLGELYIKGMQELEEWPDAQYPSLTRLKISSCPKLKEFPEILLNLEVLKLKKCDLLKKLPLSPCLKTLILVDNLVLEDWNEVFSVENGQVVAQPPPSYAYLLDLKIINCPKLQALPLVFVPEKLEISRCQLLNKLPEFSQVLQHLSIDACHDGTLVRAIPNTGFLHSLIISNISNLVSLPKWPHLPGLKVLYIRDCKDLRSLSEEETSFQSLTSLKLLSIRDCPKLVSLPDTGLPTSLESLSIGSCPSLKSLGPKEMLKSLTLLKDLYIEDCPALQSFPEKGLPHSLQHLHVEGCPSLTKQCETNRCPDWSKIMHIPDLELESIRVSSVPSSLSKENPIIKPPKSKPSSAFWYHPCPSRKEIDIIKLGEPQQRNAAISVQTERGQTSKGKGKMIRGEPCISKKCGH